MSPQINSSHAFKTPSVFYFSFAKVKMKFSHNKYLNTTTWYCAAGSMLPMSYGLSRSAPQHHY